MQYVDLHAIVQNAKYIKNYAEKPVCAVVKNNAYGHGLSRVVLVLRDIVGFFAVANVQEALQICHYTSKILILLPIFNDDLVEASNHGFVLTVDSRQTLLRYVASKLPLVVHIKTNSGMSRLGFDDIDELCEVSEILDENKQITVDGIFSHMRSGNLSDCQMQYDVFMRQADFIQNTLGKNITKHLANTSTLFCDKKYALDMVRVGLGLYGYGNENLLAAKTVKARVVANRVVDNGDTVGYDGVFRPDKITNLAVLDVGYATGFPRTMVGSGIIVNGKVAKVVAVCMGMTICQTEDIVPPGSTAILLGRGVNPSNRDTIVYELLCNLR